MADGLKGLLILGKGKGGPMPKDDDEAPPSSDGGVESEFFGKAFDAYKAGNRDAFARFMQRGVEMCVEKAKAGEYDEGE